METNYDYNAHEDMDNIIRINNSDADQDEQDFDFDYDPNELYYALLNEGNH